MNESIIKKKRNWGRILFYTIPAIVVIIVAVIVFWPLTNLKNPINSIKKTTDSKQVETAMSNIVKEYYEANVLGKVFGINRYIVTLETMEKHGLDTSSLTEDSIGCSQDSYSYVLIENPTETDVSKIKYTIENHLKCKDYESEIANK